MSTHFKNDTRQQRPPYTRNQQIAFFNFLTVLEVTPVVLLMRGLYLPAILVIMFSCLIHVYSAGGRYLLVNAPRMKMYVFRDCPISYGTMFVASFLPEGWTVITFLIVMMVHLFVGLRINKQSWEAIKLYYQNS